MVTMLYLVVLSFLSGQADWTWSVHPEAGFKILTPIPLIYDVKAVPTDVDVIQFHQYHAGSLSTGPDSMAFVIDHFIVPAQDATMDEEYLNAFFENTLDEMLVAIDGTLVYMDILHQPGREVCIWKGSYNEGKGVIRGNILLYGDRYYGLQVFGFASKKQDELMTRFLNSFKRTEEKAN
ncbi:MAG TPA: hypothetical protein VGK46_03330 [Saprospiraceae bacterium]|jgi:hypothetical protein